MQHITKASNKQSVSNDVRGLTLVELLVVIAILGILANVVFASVVRAKELARFSRAKLELRQMETALYLYNEKYNSFPDDVSRNLPPGLEEFLSETDMDNWPDAAWGGSVYDWDAWDDPGNPGQRIYQISIRFCPAGGPLAACHFPDFEWAEDFDVNSALYYCISGACRSHIAEPVNYPGYCINC